MHCRACPNIKHAIRKLIRRGLNVSRCMYRYAPLETSRCRLLSCSHHPGDVSGRTITSNNSNTKKTSFVDSPAILPWFYSRIVLFSGRLIRNQSRCCQTRRAPPTGFDEKEPQRRNLRLFTKKVTSMIWKGTPDKPMQSLTRSRSALDFVA